MAKELTPDQRRAQTRLKKNPNFYKEIGSKGGKNNPKKFTSDSGKKAVEARWAKHRADKLKDQKGEKP